MLNSFLFNIHEAFVCGVRSGRGMVMTVALNTVGRELPPLKLGGNNNNRNANFPANNNNINTTTNNSQSSPLYSTPNHHK